MNFFNKSFNYLGQAKTNSSFVKLDEQKKIEQIYDNMNRINPYEKKSIPITESETTTVVHKDRIDALKNLNIK